MVAFNQPYTHFLLKMYLTGLNSNDDVTCITMQRRLILCGTLYGSLLIFSADSGNESATDAKSVAKLNEKKRKSRRPKRNI